MKYLLVLAVVLVAIYIWRNNRIKGDGVPPARPSRPRKLASPTVMIACLHCGTHLPESEAIKGQRGAYCCSEHRQLSENGPA